MEALKLRPRPHLSAQQKVMVKLQVTGVILRDKLGIAVCEYKKIHAESLTDFLWKVGLAQDAEVLLKETAIWQWWRELICKRNEDLIAGLMKSEFCPEVMIYKPTSKPLPTQESRYEFYRGIFGPENLATDLHVLGSFNEVLNSLKM